MYYNSTRDNSCRVTSAQAISRGISAEGGLFVPQELPRLSLEEIGGLAGKTYNEKAKFILSRFLTDFSAEELAACVDSAYTDEKFDSANISEIARVGETAYLLELWHGPTCAFKDMALQMLPLSADGLLRKRPPGQGRSSILVATSGDTGKAALEGFRDVPGTRMLVFYPEDGVSRYAEAPDDHPGGRKRGGLRDRGQFRRCPERRQADLHRPGRPGGAGRAAARCFSSANSINWGRLVPQIVYYVSAYCRPGRSGADCAWASEINVVRPHRQLRQHPGGLLCQAAWACRWAS